MLQTWRGSCRGNVRTTILKNVRNCNNVGIDLPMYEVSTTRGVPSTSTNLKEALCEKIPVHYDLLRNFRQQHGSSVVSHITVDDIYKGLNGVNTMVRETAEIDPKYGIKYRGLTIPEVVTLLPHEGKSPSAESVFWLLLTGDIPTREQTASLIADWSVRREKKKDWWSGPGGGIVGSVLQTLPKTISPLARLSVALTVLDSGKHTKKALEISALTHTHWEYTYEDSMEFLATLPAIVGLVAKSEGLKNVKEEEGDWVQFLSECLYNSFDISENHRKMLMDFLRLYIVLNADEDGGIPGIHVTEILGASQLDINQAIAAGVLAYANEPKSGTMSQCMEFQTKTRRLFGREPKEERLRNYAATLIKQDRLIGYVDSEYCDPRYTAILNYAREYLPNDTDVKLSQAVTQILTTIMKAARGKNIFPEQNAIAAPIFQFYGLKDMKFNQVLLCMPASKCTYTYCNSIRGIQRKCKRGKHVKYIRK
ncbi:PREDICTED: citrate synthase, mitochondrial-like [Habropoda laboriosa]|uniref:citrate synthase, mitochondrial-like n=1 Tax=Habropoda laboriosa TaxID=597456 RepID=UPI00083DFAF1|nr:PREDICTED: citrate synthase, mitochondrial-like [Habropoda laboriosa]